MITKRITACLLFFALKLSSYGQSDNPIKQVFREFQSGYNKRDTALVERFTNDLCSKDILITGTGEDEWFEGISAAKSLFRNDWAYWLTLAIDTSNIKLTTSDNVAFFMVHGTASIKFASKQAAYDFAVQQLQQVINKETTNRNILLAYSSEASNLIQQIESGNLEIVYSIRLAGGLMKQNGKWVFKQLIFSFPYPMTRK